MSGENTTIPNCLPYLVFNGIEFNGYQCWQYIRNAGGMGDFRVVAAGTPPVILLDDPNTGSPRTFVSPSADPAPWYDPSFPESADFLGLWIEHIAGLDSMLSRNIDTRIAGAGGGVLGPLRSMERKLDFVGMCLANTQAGMDYGIRWLTYALQGNQISQCQPSDMDIRTTDPDGYAADTGRWWLYNCGLLSGPTYDDPPIDQMPDKMRPVKFTIASEMPWLYKRLSAEEPTSLYDGTGCVSICDWLTEQTDYSVNMVSASQMGEECAIVTLYAGSQAATAYLVVRTNPGQLSLSNVNLLPYPPTDPTVEYIIQLGPIPAGTNLVYDASQKTVIFNSMFGPTDGTRYIGVPPGQGLSWPTATQTTGITIDVVVPLSWVNDTTEVDIQKVFRTF